jgi:hypothetical protein
MAANRVTYVTNAAHCGRRCKGLNDVIPRRMGFGPLIRILSPTARAKQGEAA